MNKTNRGFVLFEMVVSMSFMMIVLLCSLQIATNAIKRNNEVYNESSIRNTLSLVMYNIGNDFYQYNISKIDGDNGTYKISYVKDVDGVEKTLKISDGIITYDNREFKFRNNNYKFNDITINKDLDNDILKLTINYNNNKTIDIVSINYRGD